MNVLVEKRLEWRRQKINYERALEDARRLEGRFRVADGENFMESVVTRRISTCQTQIDLLAGRIKLIDEAVVILLNTRFDSLLELTNPKGRCGAPA